MKNCNVLIVDDMMHLREALAFFFKKKGFTVFEACNGKIAFNILNEATIGLIISDIRMPELGGLELLQQVRRTSSLSHIPFIFVSAFADLSNDEAFHNGANDIFPKPFDAEDILNASIELLKPVKSRWMPNKLHAPEGIKKVILKAQEMHLNSPGQPINFGKSGFFVQSNEQPPEVGDLLHFKIEFEKGVLTDLKCLGQVAWTRVSTDGQKSPGYGVQIREVDMSMKDAFIDLIEPYKGPITIPAY